MLVGLISEDDDKSDVYNKIVKKLKLDFSNISNRSHNIKNCYVKTILIRDNKKQRLNSLIKKKVISGRDCLNSNDESLFVEMINKNANENYIRANYEKWCNMQSVIYAYQFQPLNVNQYLQEYWE